MRVIDIWSICSGLQIISPKQSKILRCCSINIKDISLIDPFVDFYSIKITLSGQIKTLIGPWVIENNISTTIIGNSGVIRIGLIGKTNITIVCKISIYEFAMICFDNSQFIAFIFIYQNIVSILNNSCLIIISYYKDVSFFRHITVYNKIPS